MKYPNNNKYHGICEYCGFVHENISEKYTKVSLTGNRFITCNHKLKTVYGGEQLCDGYVKLIPQEEPLKKSAS